MLAPVLNVHTPDAKRGSVDVYTISEVRSLEVGVARKSVTNVPISSPSVNKAE